VIVRTLLDRPFPPKPHPKKHPTTSNQVTALPPLRPLVLTAKALLKEAGLNEVFTGGLSSYSLFNMAVAHLQCEGLAPDGRPAGVNEASLLSDEQQTAFLEGLAGQPTGRLDLGVLLQGFFQRFGKLLRPTVEAVSIPGGGIVAKQVGVVVCVCWLVDWVGCRGLCEG